MVFKSWIFTFGRLKQGSYLSLHTNISSTWIRDLHIRPETLKLIEETHQDIGIDDDFLNRIPIA
jgi:hypothetical protein